MSLFKFVLRPAAFLAAFSTVLVGPRPSHADWTVTEAMKQTASFEVKNASTDDYYLAVAQAYHLNLFLDSTHLPQNAPPITAKFENATMWAKVRFFGSRHNINGEPLDGGKTVLLWQQPDLQPIARALITQREVKAVPADTPDLGRLVMHDSVLAPQLSAFFKDKKGWQGQRPFHTTSTFEELPDELKNRLAVQARGFSWNLTGTKVLPLWFSDEFWNSVLLRSIEGRDSKTGAPRSEIAVTGVVKTFDDKSVQEECVYIMQPELPFRMLQNLPAQGNPRLTNKRPVAQPAQPDNDTVLAQSSLAVPYKPLPAGDVDLAGEAALDSKVTLSLKRQPLSSVVKAISEKGGVVLSVSPTITARGTLLTVSLEAMPLREAMTALTRLLGLEWSKAEGGGYSANRERGTALDVQLLQARQLHPVTQVQEVAAIEARKAQEAKEWNDKIVQAIGKEPFNRPEGVPFTDLPDDLQIALKDRVRTGLAPVFVNTQSLLRQRAEDLNGVWHLELDVPVEAVTAVTVKTAAGNQRFDVNRPAMVKIVSQTGQVLTSVALQEATQIAG